MKALLNHKKAPLLAVCLSVLLAAFLVTGCGNWVDNAHIHKALELCKNNGGLKHLAIFNADNAVCNNGAVFTREKWMNEFGG